MASTADTEIDHKHHSLEGALTKNLQYILRKTSAKLGKSHTYKNLYLHITFKNVRKLTTNLCTCINLHVYKNLGKHSRKTQNIHSLF